MPNKVKMFRLDKIVKTTRAPSHPKLIKAPQALHILASRAIIPLPATKIDNERRDGSRVSAKNYGSMS